MMRRAVLVVAVAAGFVLVGLCEARAPGRAELFAVLLFGVVGLIVGLIAVGVGRQGR
jgi:hypothetical protein